MSNITTSLSSCFFTIWGTWVTLTDFDDTFLFELLFFSVSFSSKKFGSSMLSRWICSSFGTIGSPWILILGVTILGLIITGVIHFVAGASSSSTTNFLLAFTFVLGLFVAFDFLASKLLLLLQLQHHVPFLNSIYLLSFTK